jgi:hypothetical protein
MTSPTAAKAIQVVVSLTGDFSLRTIAFSDHLRGNPYQLSDKTV